jgi:phosphatidylserine/phosphatidylglycerophosphate/cardiolipin synthase-like enzyme
LGHSKLTGGGSILRDAVWTMADGAENFSGMILSRIRAGRGLGLVGLLAVMLSGAHAAERLFAASPLGPVIAAAGAARDPLDPAIGNRLALIGNGYDALLLRVHLIRQARASICIQTFIWTHDECGRLLIYELLEAARRGVKVRIIADHIISEKDPATMAFLATAHPNFEVRNYRPAFSRMNPSLWQKLLAGLRSFRDLNQRMHNKVLLVDDVVLVTGGRNIENTYFDHSTTMNFLDRDVLAVGPVVPLASAAFERYWRYEHVVASRALPDVAAAIARGEFRRYEQRADYDFGPHFVELDLEANDRALIETRFADRLKPVQRVTFVSDEPGKALHGSSGMSAITKELRETLERAKVSIVMQTPYLVLSPPARTLIKELHGRNPGLSIRISSNSFASTDNLFAYSANYRLRNLYIEELGLTIHEMKPLPASLLAVFPRQPQLAELAAKAAPKGKPASAPFLCLHAKSLVVDGRIAFVGTYNLDPRSENLNTEVGLIVEDEPFARELLAEIERDLLPENSWIIARRPLPLRLEAVNSLVENALAWSPLDLWPIQNTSSFELLPGAKPVPPGHPDFYRNHRDAGSFPGTDGVLSTKEIMTRLYKAVGSPLTPIL